MASPAALLKKALGFFSRGRSSAREPGAGDDALMRERMMLRALIDNLPDFVYAKDAECRFLLANAAVAEHMGTTPAQLLGKTDFAFFPPELANVYCEDERAVMRSGKPLINREEAGLDAKGNHITILTTKVPLLDEDGRAIGILGIGRDISARVKGEAEAREARRAAEAANRAKSEFLANMSHEIRTPLNGVLGMTELLLDSKLDREQRDFAETIRDSGRALLTVINDILDFSKIEAGKLELEVVDMDVRELVESVGRLLALQARAKGLELTIDVDPALPASLHGDPHRLRQILLNLGGNAVKFTQAGEVSVEVTCSRAREDALNVRFEVRDSGIGIPQERLQALFQPFSQVDSSTTRKFGGTGLGLSIVRQLVALMQGECGVESEEGRGSRFWFTVPLARGSQSAAQSQRFVPTRVAGRKIIAVDDNATNRSVLAAQTKQFGVQAMLASSAGEARQLLRDAVSGDEPYEVALVDKWHSGSLPIVSSEELQSRRVSAVAGKRVLLAEDNVVNQRVVQHMLQRMGYEVHIVSDGKEAVAAWSSGAYDVILMDCQMPNLDGYAATREIRSREKSDSHIPIIALTAHALKGADEECFRAGMDHYLSKPVDREQLQFCLERQWS